MNRLLPIVLLGFCALLNGCGDSSQMTTPTPDSKRLSGDRVEAGGAGGGEPSAIYSPSAAVEKQEPIQGKNGVQSAALEIQKPVVEQEKNNDACEGIEHQ